MRIRLIALLSVACLLTISAPIHSQAQQREWLKKLAENLPQYTITASPISREGQLSPDGKWLATTYELDPDSDTGPWISAHQHGVQILDRTGKVVENVTFGHDFFSVSRLIWGKDSNTLYFEYGDRMRPGTRDVPVGPVVWQAAIGTRMQPTPCTKTAFTQMPLWSPRGDRYLIEERDRSHAKVNGEGERFILLLTSPKRKSRLMFHDAVMPAWSPDGRRILLINFPPARGQDLYLRIADSRSGKERAFKDTMSSWAENFQYGWVKGYLYGAVWLADSKHLLMGVTATRKDRGQIKASFVVSAQDGSRVLIPGIYPHSGSRNGRTILIERPDNKLFLLDLTPKRRRRGRVSAVWMHHRSWS